jgi:hypothetical protein
MGRQLGLVILSGQFGNTQLSIDGTKGFAKLSVPVSKETIMTAPSYDLTRKNMSEFTGAGYAAKTILQCSKQAGNTFGERFLFSRLVKLTRMVVVKGPGDNGKRSFEASQNLTDFEGINLDRKESFLTRFVAPYTLDANPDRNTLTLDVAAFPPRKMIMKPKGATHFRVFLTAGVLSDYIYVGGDEKYAATQPNFNGRAAYSDSGFIEIDLPQAPAFQLVTSLPGAPILPTDATLLAMVGIEFFKIVNNNGELFATGNAMMIAKAF